MRNAVVVVSFCIGVAAGYIAPSGTPEAPTFGSTIEGTNVGNLDGRIYSINSILDSPLTEKITTLQNASGVNDEALYEHGQKKQNNVNERSFLFLNQKYKKPARAQHHLAGASCDIFDQSLKEEGVEQLSGTPFKFSNSYYEEPYKQLPNANANKPETGASYFAPPNNCKLDEKGDKNTPKNELTNAQRDYLELLKEPILRMGKIPNQFKEKQILPSKAHPLNKEGAKQYYIVPKTVQETRLSGMVKNYGYTRPYLLHRPVFNKELDTVDTNFLNDDDVQRVLNSGGEDKLLDRFLKATLTEQEHRERAKGTKADCTYHDCVLKTTKRVPNSNLGHEADCKCGRWLHLKSTIIKDRQQRGHYKKYETTAEPISAEQNSYEDGIKPEPYKSKSTDYELKRSMRKFKNLLHE